MPKLLQMNFPHAGPFGRKMAEELLELAQSIAKEPGLRWKLWIENKATGEAGGIYLFEHEDAARSYLKMHTARLKQLGVPQVQAKVFDVNEDLSAICHAPLNQSD